MTIYASKLDEQGIAESEGLATSSGLCEEKLPNICVANSNRSN